jgi:hypothetical protein
MGLKGSGAPGFCDGIHYEMGTVHDRYIEKELMSDK